MPNKGGAPKGNKNKAKGTMFRDALRKAVKQHPESVVRRNGVLVKLCTKLIDEGLDGNLGATKEVADRLDGKSQQAVEIKGDNPITVIKRVVIQAASEE